MSSKVKDLPVINANNLFNANVYLDDVDAGNSDVHTTVLAITQLILSCIGFMDYNDSGASQSIDVVNNPTVLTNDELGSATHKSERPTGVTDIWIAANDQFEWDDLNVGDMVEIRFDMLLTTLTPNTEIHLDLRLAIGAGEYTISFIAGANFKNAGDHRETIWMGVYMGDANTLNNPARFELTTDKDCTAVVNGWYCKITKKPV